MDGWARLELRQQTFLVTGGAGFIGSHMAEFLLALGHQVRVLDNLSQGRREWVPEAAEFLEGEIAVAAVCRRAVEGVDGVFHMAAMSKVAPSIERIEFCTEQNVLGTQNLLVACRQAKIRKLVYSGSSTCYGLQAPPHHEDLLPHCLNPYALSKYVGEQYCGLFTRLYGLPTVSLRYFNVYGPRQPREGAYALVMGIFLDQFKKGEPLTIHGDGSQRRDFVHVRDVVRANWQAYQSAVQDTVLNVGTGTNISIKELADMISKNQIFQPRRRGDADVTLADISRIKALTGWQPQVRFADGLAELMEQW
jgi:nucleoside-diphosphate-sugar epimerase